MAVLVVADHDNSAIVPIVLNTVTAAAAIDAEVHVLVAGNDAGAAAVTAGKIVGVSKVLHVDGAAYEHQLAEALAPVVVAQAGSYSICFRPTPPARTSLRASPRCWMWHRFPTSSKSCRQCFRAADLRNAMATVQSSDR